MATKNNPGVHDCYATAEPDEPLFILLARDRHAPTLIWLWAVLRELDGEDSAKVAEARDCAMAMIHWQIARGRKTVGLGVAGLAAVLDLIRAANTGMKVLRSVDGANAANVETDDAVMRLFLSATECSKPPGEAAGA